MRKTGMLLAYRLYRANGLNPCQAMTAIYVARRAERWTIGNIERHVAVLKPLSDERCDMVRLAISHVAPIR